MSALVHGAHLFVVSGCSGSGKSTLIAALAAQGASVVLEPGRRIVKEELAAGGDALPWRNAQRFIDRCALQANVDFDQHVAQPQRTFFDRSLIDVAAAVVRSGLRAPAVLTQALATKRYATTVFMSAPWKALFATDAERRHGFDEAVAEYDTLLPTYRHYGYDIVDLPQLSVAQRVAFVLATVTARARDAS
ncbi:MAG: AAA family ATPase [Casimicrobiaceae bacterium]